MKQSIAWGSRKDLTMGWFWEVRLTSLRTGFGRDPALGWGILWMTPWALTGLFSTNLLEGFLMAFLVAVRIVKNEFSSAYLCLTLHPSLKAHVL